MSEPKPELDPTSATCQSGKFCEDCGKPANYMLEFTDHGEVYARHYYCYRCIDAEEALGIQEVDRKAKEEKQHE